VTALTRTIGHCGAATSPGWFRDSLGAQECLRGGRFPRTATVQRALEQIPCSVATLARAAGVPQSTLARIQAGERNATPAVARAVARALDQWSTSCARLARTIRRAYPRRNR